MSYQDFTLENVDIRLGVRLVVTDVIPGLPKAVPPPWVSDLIVRGLRQSLISEKSRGEFLVVPLLLAAQDISPRPFTIHSGVRLDVDGPRGLVGEFDYLLGAGAPIPVVKAPLAVIVEAKRQDIDAGLGQCIAQMYGARLFNEQAGTPVPVIFGAVTTGELWRFLRLSGSRAEIDPRRWYLDDLAGILGALREMVSASLPEAVAA